MEVLKPPKQSSPPPKAVPVPLKKKKLFENSELHDIIGQMNISSSSQNPNSTFGHEFNNSSIIMSMAS